ncbi:hypothetical protein M422DRAFT_259968 [Sphaerobolus stellatus SS14]|uniref:Uncharacterized protein n=1 Tax=Sphaerobolus stellatus (strain SS14) TaxID=990650 RepID=A0A0C9U3W6_SPHS4|nr:hypothetical protein M422DRAFT_259968 [Sphaerobolus stellatus SS14]
MECTLSNPFVPRASIIRYPNGIFEMRLHLHGVSSTVEVVPHENYVLVTGRLVPRARIDRFGYASSLVWSDQACGYFSRDIPVRLSPGTRASLPFKIFEFNLSNSLGIVDRHLRASSRLR